MTLPDSTIIRKHVEPTPAFTEATALFDRLLDNVELVVVGKHEQIQLVLCALLCRGHVLFEDVPGTAKTVLARAIAQSIEGAHASRVQCTPDLQPTDVTGLSVYNQKEREFEFRPGPVFANIVLVDEINRAMPRTQSALLEAMAERQITVDGNDATRRRTPSSSWRRRTRSTTRARSRSRRRSSTASSSRRRSATRPRTRRSRSSRRSARRTRSARSARRSRSRSCARIQDAVEDVYIDPLLQHWLIRLVRATRGLDAVSVGASVRGSLALERAARAWALTQGRPFVQPEDVEQLFVPVLGHRILLNPYRVEENGHGAPAPSTSLRALPRPGRRDPGSTVDVSVGRADLPARLPDARHRASPAAHARARTAAAATRSRARASTSAATACARSTGRPRRACRAPASRTSSSSATPSPRRARAPSSSSTAGRGWRSTRPSSRGCTSPPRSRWRVG